MIWVNRTSCGAIAAAVLFAGLPSWQHAHVDGDQSHAHSQREPQSHDRANHSHQHGHVPHRHGLGLAKHRPHVHLALFGLPLQVRDESDPGQPTYVASPSATVSAVADWQFCDFADPALIVGEPICIALKQRTKTAIAARLSDNARHERSGVQLI